VLVGPFLRNLKTRHAVSPSNIGWSMLCCLFGGMWMQTVMVLQMSAGNLVLAKTESQKQRSIPYSVEGKFEPFSDGLQNKL
jgi:hypothetical protein